MKKLVLSAALMLVGMGAFAQASFGVKLGANLSQTVAKVGNLTVKSDRIIGYNLGVVAQAPINDMFSFAPELLFTTKGGKFEEDGYKETYRLNYLETPLLVRGMFADRFYVNAGPSLGYWMGGKFKGEEGGESYEATIKFVDGEPETYEEDVAYMDKNYVNRFELGLSIGGGVAVTESVLVDLRYNHGLTTLVKPEGDEDYSEKNNNLSLSLIYMFGK